MFVVIGFSSNKSGVGKGATCGLAFCKPCGSATNGFVYNCGCLRSNS